jgi:recombination protein RecA
MAMSDRAERHLGIEQVFDYTISGTRQTDMIARSRSPSFQVSSLTGIDLHAIARAVNKQMHAPAVRVGAGPTPKRDVVSSGFPALDAITGFGGFPRGRLTDLIGRPTAGRETVAAHAIAGAGGYSAWVDVAGVIDVDALARCRVDLERLFILRPREREDALAVAAQVIAGDQFAVVVFDALSDLAPGGMTAEAVARFVRVIGPSLGRGSTAALVLSAPEQHYRSLAHAAALRISLVRAGIIRQGGVFRGWRAHASVVKSPGRQGAETGIEVWL